MDSSAEHLAPPARMPVLFVGHGNPMNGIEDNVFSRGWRAMAGTLPRPTAICCVSAHWEMRGTLVTAMAQPCTIHDFGGFPPALYQVEYPAPGSPALAREIQRLVSRATVGLDDAWGLDHGCWSVVRQMYPAADIPVVQVSLDRNKSPREHYALARELAPLRAQGVLVLASGNMVHNLRLADFARIDANNADSLTGYDWALTANARFKQLIDARDHAALIDYPALGDAVQLAINSAEHYLPLLYALALQEDDEPLSYFNDLPVAGSLTMTSLRIG